MTITNLPAVIQATPLKNAQVVSFEAHRIQLKSRVWYLFRQHEGFINRASMAQCLMLRELLQVMLMQTPGDRKAQADYNMVRLRMARLRPRNDDMRACAEVEHMYVELPYTKDDERLVWDLLSEMTVEEVAVELRDKPRIQLLVAMVLQDTLADAEPSERREWMLKVAALRKVAHFRLYTAAL